MVTINRAQSIRDMLIECVVSNEKDVIQRVIAELPEEEVALLEKFVYQCRAASQAVTANLVAETAIDSDDLGFAPLPL